MSDLETGTSNSSPRPSPPTPSFAAATAPSYVHTVFWGPDGLRAGWGFLFYLIAFLLLQRFAVQLAWARDLGDSGLWSRMLEEFGSFLAGLLPAVVLARVERRPWGAYGLPLKPTFGRLFWIGAVWGFLAISLLIFPIYELHAFVPGHVVLRGTRLLRFAAFWAVFFLLVGLYEDFLFRGYSQFTLTRGIGFWPAALALSCLFGLIHRENAGESWSGVLMAALIGLFFCFTLRRTGSLWFAIGFHATWDWGETFFYGVPDSGWVAPGRLLRPTLAGPNWVTGGSVGPEGSVFCLIVVALTWIAFHRIFPPVKSAP